jgi:hypothetical protein
VAFDPIMPNTDYTVTAVTVAQKQMAELEAERDRLMLEFCPAEMTPQQIESWKSHQTAANVELTDREIEAIADTTDILYVATGEGDYGDNSDAIVPFARAVLAAAAKKGLNHEG